MSYHPRVPPSLRLSSPRSRHLSDPLPPCPAISQTIIPQVLSSLRLSSLRSRHLSDSHRSGPTISQTLIPQVPPSLRLLSLRSHHLSDSRPSGPTISQTRIPQQSGGAWRSALKENIYFNPKATKYAEPSISRGCLLTSTNVSSVVYTAAGEG
ncbi:hypothetical protein AB205_0046700 [Aquarana catesbeiana]|uniref:Uncharacterized protein n=1 Tax=Aquarana catesbeiana TaxID=8400 RepID=A0A2G9RV22_AQUCT|nr:hypothetical protein AB205_0046700 [Aquarana catesbeiana]